MNGPSLPESAPPRRTYEFGPFRLDELERRLLHGQQEIPLTIKTCEVLLLLLKSGGRTITKEEFMREVWRDTTVEEANLTHNISTLRQILGDDARDPKYIRTVARVGYRFVAPVAIAEPALIIDERSLTHVVIDEEISDPQRPSSERRWIMAAAIAGLAALGFAIVAAVGGLQSRRVDQPELVVEQPPVVFPVTTYADQEFSPALSPDGRLVAFAWQGGSRDIISLFVRQADVGEPVRLTSTLGRDGSPAWSPDGRYLAFMRRAAKVSESGIFLIPALGGTERRLLAAAEVGGLSWSPDGNTLAFAVKKSADEPYAVSLLDVKTLDVRPLTLPPPDSFGDYWLAFSPDGSRIAFVRLGSDSTSADLYVTALHGGEPRRITFDGRRIVGVAWDRRRDLLIFSSARNDREILWKVPAAGGTPTPLDPTVEDALDPSVSRNGEALVYTRLTSDANIYRLDLTSNAAPAPLIASSRHDQFPRVSPDGRRLAFESDRSGENEIWLADADGSNPGQLTASGRAGAASPAWSPDGQQIVFVSHPAATSEIYVIAAAGGRARRLTTQSNCVAPSWSRDGRSIYFSTNRDGRWQVWRVPVAGGDAVQVTRDGGYESAESFDGRFLFYTKYGYNTVGLYRQRLPAGAEEIVYPFLQLLSLGDWALTERGIYFIHRYDRYEGGSERAKKPGIRFLDFATREVREIAPLADPGSGPGLSIVDGGSAVIFSRATKNSDVMLIRNYR